MSHVRTSSRIAPLLRSASLAIAMGLSPAVFAAVTASVTGILPAEGIYPGETATLRITLSNNDNAAAATSVAFSNSLPGTLPNGLKVAGAASSTCGGTFTANLNGQALSLVNGTIPQASGGTDGSCVIDIPVTAGTSTGTATSYAYELANGAVSSSGGTNTGNVSQTFTIRALSRPQISKNFSSNTLILGGASTSLVITLNNPNPVSMSGVGITDNFPSTIKVATPLVANTTCGGTFAPAVGDGSITSSGGTIPANGSCSYTVNVDAAQTNGTYSSTQTNRIDRTTGFINSLGIAAQADATDDITVRSPLSIAKIFSHSQLSNGQSDSMTITLSNSGNSALSITSFDDSPIDGIGGGNAATGLTIDSVSNSCGGAATAINNNKGVRLTGGSIPAGGNCTVTVNFTGHVQSTGVPVTYTNNIPEGAVNVGNPAIKSQAASADILVFDDLRVLKSVSPTFVAPGNPIRYQITVQNFGVGAVNNVVITDTFTQGQTYLTGTINGVNYTPTVSGSCTAVTSPSTVGSTAPQLTIDAVGGRGNANNPGSCTVTMWAMASSTPIASSSNVLPAGSVCYNSGATCNGGSSNTTSTQTNADVLTATKTFAESSPGQHSFPEGTIVRMTITLGNRSANALTNVAISDTLQLDSGGGGGQLRIANPPNAATTCGSGSITAVAGATSVSMNNGTIQARANNGMGADGSCILQVDVVGPAGVFPNTATVGGTQSYGNGTTQTAGPVTTNTAQLTYTSALTATKGFSPASVSSGGKSTVTIRLTNSSNLALTNVQLTDPLPTGMTVADPAHAYSTCSGNTSVTATPGANSVSLTGANIAGGGNCALLFDVIATGNSNWTNTIPANTITADGGVRNVANVVGVLAFAPATGMSISKATSISSLTFPGQISRLTINVSNGTNAVTNLRFTDYFTTDGTSGTANNGWVLTPNPEPQTNCPGGLVSAQPNGHSVTLTGANLAANATCQISANVTSTVTGGNTNTIPTGALETDQGFSNSNPATTSLAISANVGIVKQFTPNVVKPGERSRLRITFYNALAQPISNLAVTDTLPSGVTVPSGANPTTTCAGGNVTSTSTSVTINGGTIAAANGSSAASCQVEIDVLVASAGDYINTIPASAVTASAGGDNVTNTQPTSDTLRARQPLTVHKAFSNLTLDMGNPAGFTTGSDSKAPGSSATLTIRIGNPNASPLTGAALTDNLPTNLVVANTPAAGNTCGGTVIAEPSATSIRFTGGTIPANGSCDVTVNVLSNISGTYTNAIDTESVVTNEGVTNEEPTRASLIVSKPPTVGKQFVPAVIPPNGISRLSIVIGNDNDSAMTLTANFDDVLPTAPGQIRVAATPDVQSTCTGTVQAAASATTVRLNNGGTIPAGGCTISVNVTGVAAGVHTNNIPAGALKTSLGNNQEPANATLTISTQAYISGKVFKDNNVAPNGTFQSGLDTPIAGVTIELHSGPTCGGALVSATTTDPLGNYLFSPLAAGAYSVCQPGPQPTGTTNGITTAGTISGINSSTGTSGVGSNPTATSSQIINIVLNADGMGGESAGSVNNNFAEVGTSTISGIVFKDQNNNGVQNGADDPLANVTIQLTGTDSSGNAVSKTTTTAADGSYSFAGLQPGTYTVTEPTQPPATSNGITTPGAVPNSGTAGTATATTVTPSRISNIILPPNTTSAGNNFAEVPNGGTISGQVFLDFDDSGAVNGNDHGIGGQTINLTGTDISGNAVSKTTTTAADGSYSFVDLPEGTYTVTQPAPQAPGTTNGKTIAGSTGGTPTAPSVPVSVIANIPLTGANAVSAGNNFAEIPGNAPDLAIAKSHSPASLAEGSTSGLYTIKVSNVGVLATSGTVTVVDTLPAGLTALSVNGGGVWNCTNSVTSVTCNTNAVINANGGTVADIVVRVAVATGTAGQILVNTAKVSGGGEPPGFESNNTAIDPTAVAKPAAVSGHVWLDLNHDRVNNDTSPPALVQGWQVELLLNGVVVDRTTTDTSGGYNFPAVNPAVGYQVRFRHPTTGMIFGNAVPNEAATPFNNGTATSSNPAGAKATDGTLSDMKLLSGETYPQQSLPLDPAGVVYDAVTRNPVGGAVVTISGPPGFNAATHLVGGNANFTTGIDGLYQFLLNPGAPAGTYTLTISTYPGGYLPQPSSLIPVCSASLNVGAIPDPALVQTSITAPSAAAPLHNPAACPTSSAGLAAGASSTQHYFTFVLDPTSANVLNNHIPLDPILGGAIVMTKSTPLVNVVRGDLVPYTITATNTLNAALPNINVVDTIPAGFRYKKGSSTLNGANIEPTVTGRNLTWKNQAFTAGERKVWRMLMVVGAGVSEGEYVNRVSALNSIANAQVSNLATATVRVVPDPTFDCSDIIGKVFDDKNANGYQDQDEPGIPNVRVATARGLLVTTDHEGRFHVACADIPNADRGANFVMKLDERTLPSGYRVTTENPRDVRVTRGKMTKLNFGATVHRVVRVELSAAAFDGNGTQLQTAYAAELDKLPAQLQERPSVLRIAYRQGAEPTDLAQKRIDVVSKRIRELWKEKRKKEEEDDKPLVPLMIETEMEAAQ
ncbi:MAG TPA: SdrD B-like domain-containing protein [Oxalicibacterium sp.]|uniref:DUF7933 domain-containing protein n=1 Tax=Oxalicibacterium sp. TaxID=2766525 RepID=UPI002B705665|nr:SdrD B-like domain-containing protein [Oxalicibacterium sp.]HWU99195.1 SdrD B-like domain-containing protein [Oxalicibacterium sp.]